MAAGLDQLKHIVVLMMENRSFDHMLGSLTAVDLQIFGGDTSAGRVANMQGFVKSYFNQQRDVGHSQKIMYYFAQNQLPVLTTLATEFAVFNRWFASIPGPTICNRAFAHYGTSFGRVDMDLLYVNEPV